jgi:predicted Zn-dependent protease
MTGTAGGRRWRATLHEGQGASETRRDVEVSVAPAGLFIHTRSAGPVLWPYKGTKYQSGGLPRFDRDKDTLIVTSKDIVPAIEATHAEALALMRSSAISLRDVGMAAAAVGIVVAGALAIWFLLIPLIGRLASGAVPVAWEEKMGESVAASFKEQHGSCEDPSLVSAIAEITARLERAAPPSPYKFRVSLSRNDMVNAFAAPGGYIVVCRGLIEHAESPEEVAGVLAHEMEHVRQRHVTGAIFRDASLAVAIGLSAGDAGSLATLATTLGSLQFRRDDELSADSAGMASLIRAQIDPRGMIAFFRKLALSGDSLPDAASFLSTHPATSDRIETLERLAKPASASVPLRSSSSWPTLRQACRMDLKAARD